MAAAETAEEASETTEASPSAEIACLGNRHPVSSCGHLRRRIAATGERSLHEKI